MVYFCIHYAYLLESNTASFSFDVTDSNHLRLPLFPTSVAYSYIGAVIVMLKPVDCFKLQNVPHLAYR